MLHRPNHPSAEYYETLNYLDHPETTPTTRASLIVASVLLDIRDQNTEIIKLLQGVHKHFVGG